MKCRKGIPVELGVLDFGFRSDQVPYCTMLSIKNFTHVSTNFMPIWIEIQTWSKHKKGTLTYLFLAEKEINFLSQTPVS